ncbi:DeoR/GlpR family DNA-binding transcription regulator [Lacrimispora xylanolytica]|uniref:DeoR/GlpR family DNA-binding transcription regulator n=1 Tax=Lacrimispora xylanolytica TaxID=29375 RepID=A0ABY7ABF3_9FIRM|nr:DeoR/GlpR family DNA-binding transcription regulator [Lacrimispora xylanolytica]WAJ22873.1 DeoR/GlpR family DNA-binding transcription regulator [Lacrimispora xylanolytica]
MKKDRACVDNRRNRILALMEKNPRVRVDELADILEVSLITIRRDLQYLEDRKLLVRTHGGAVASQNPMDEISLYRKLIAEFAAGFVTDNDTLFINTSSNALKILEHISCSNVTVITNNGKAIHCDHSQEVNVVLTGGELRYPKEAMVGDFALRNLQTIYAKKAFIGCSGISAENGMTTELFNEVSINEMMVSHATQEVYVLADHTKIGKNSSFVSCPIDKIKYLITDEKASTEALDLIREKGVTVYVVSRKDK